MEPATVATRCRRYVPAHHFAGSKNAGPLYVAISTVGAFRSHDDGETWVANLKRNRRIHLDIVKRNQQASSFKVLPKRWIVERTSAWLGNSRRLARDYEKRLDHSESFIYISMAKRMLLTFA
jgi:transposase